MAVEFIDTETGEVAPTRRALSAKAPREPREPLRVSRLGMALIVVGTLIGGIYMGASSSMAEVAELKGQIMFLETITP